MQMRKIIYKLMNRIKPMKKTLLLVVLIGFIALFSNEMYADLPACAEDQDQPCTNYSRAGNMMCGTHAEDGICWVEYSWCQRLHVDANGDTLAEVFINYIDVADSCICAIEMERKVIGWIIGNSHFEELVGVPAFEDMLYGEEYNPGTLLKITVESCYRSYLYFHNGRIMERHEPCDGVDCCEVIYQLHYQRGCCGIRSSASLVSEYNANDDCPFPCTSWCAAWSHLQVETAPLLNETAVEPYTGPYLPKISSLYMEISNTELKIIPNPVNSSQCNLSLFSDIMGSVVVEIFSSNGEKLTSINVDKNSTALNYSLNLAQFANGKYFCIVSIDEVVIATESIIIER
jgi:hypothetical protein